MNMYELLTESIAQQKITNTLLTKLVSGGAVASDSGEASNDTTSTKSTSKKSAGKKKASDEKTKKPSISIQQANDSAIALKDAHGVAVVKGILEECGVGKLAQMKEDQAESVYNACVAKMAELDGGEEEEEEDDI